jgi:hypothetical protein
VKIIMKGWGINMNKRLSNYQRLIVKDGKGVEHTIEFYIDNKKTRLRAIINWFKDEENRAKVFFGFGISLLVLFVFWITLGLIYSSLHGDEQRKFCVKSYYEGVPMKKLKLEYPEFDCANIYYWEASDEVRLKEKLKEKNN